MQEKTSLYYKKYSDVAFDVVAIVVVVRVAVIVVVAAK